MEGLINQSKIPAAEEVHINSQEITNLKICLWGDHDRDARSLRTALQVESFSAPQARLVGQECLEKNGLMTNYRNRVHTNTCSYTCSYWSISISFVLCLTNMKYILKTKFGWQFDAVCVAQPWHWILASANFDRRSNSRLKPCFDVSEQLRISQLLKYVEYIYGLHTLQCQRQRLKYWKHFVFLDCRPILPLKYRIKAGKTPRSKAFGYPSRVHFSNRIAQFTQLLRKALGFTNQP